MTSLYTYPPLRKEQLRAVMGIHRNTMTKYLREMIRQGLLPESTSHRRLLRPPEVEAFCRHFGISRLELP